MNNNILSCYVGSIISRHFVNQNMYIITVMSCTFFVRMFYTGPQLKPCYQLYDSVLKDFNILKILRNG